MTEEDSSFARVKLRRRLVQNKGDEEELFEPVEYQESGEEEDDHQSVKKSTCPFSLCWPFFCIFEWFMSIMEKTSGVRRPFLLLYSGYCISCVGDRLWTFAIVFVLERLGGMRLVCINQFIDAMSSMLLSGYLGNWLDRHDRRFGTLTVLAVNNVSVAASALMLFICLSTTLNTLLYSSCIVMSILFCALSKCASEAEKLSFTKDWIVVLAEKEGAETLSKKNAMMTVIDQTSSVVAPIITSYSLTFLGYPGACAFFVAVNLAFWVVERALLTRVYTEVEELHTREKLNDSDPRIREELDLLTQQQKHVPLWRRLGTMLHAYYRQSIFPAAFGLAMLYMTVLGFDGLAISFGKSQKLPDDVIGWFRSAGSVLGITGAASYATAERRFGVRSAGFIGLLFQQIFIYLCVVSIVLPGSPFNPQAYWNETTWESWWSRFIGVFYMSAATTEQQLTNIGKNLTLGSSPPSSALIDWSTLTSEGHQLTSIFVFFMGLTLARLGLWMADLSITQIMQEHVPERERGTVFGVHSACCQLFSVAKDVVVIVLPDARTFGYLIIMSVLFVIGGFANYVYYLWKTRQTSTISHENRQSSRRLLHDFNGHSKTGQELKPLNGGVSN